MVDTETIKLKFDGKDAEFEIKEHLSFGDVESLMDKCATVDEETGQPKLSLSKFRMGLLTKALVKAPFNINEPVINSLSYDNIKPLIQVVSRKFPFQDYLTDWMETYLGQEALNEINIASTDSVPQTSDGIKKKSTPKK